MIQVAVPDSHVFEWIASSLMAILVGMCSALFVRTGVVEKKLLEFIATVRTALLGVDNSGGMIHKVDFLMKENAKLPTLFHEERLVIRDEWQDKLTTLMTEIHEDFEKLGVRLERLEQRRRDRDSGEHDKDRFKQ